MICYMIHLMIPHMARARLQTEDQPSSQLRMTKELRRQKKAIMQSEPELNLPFIPTKFQCPKARCTTKSCTLLHPEQFKGGDVDQTYLRVCNLLHFQFSRGVWFPPWSQVFPLFIVYDAVYDVTMHMMLYM